MYQQNESKHGGDPATRHFSEKNLPPDLVLASKQDPFVLATMLNILYTKMTREAFDANKMVKKVMKPSLIGPNLMSRQAAEKIVELAQSEYHRTRASSGNPIDHDQTPKLPTNPIERKLWKNKKAVFTGLLVLATCFFCSGAAITVGNNIRKNGQEITPTKTLIVPEKTRTTAPLTPTNTQTPAKTPTPAFCFFISQGNQQSASEYLKNQLKYKDYRAVPLNPGDPEYKDNLAHPNFYCARK